MRKRERKRYAVGKRLSNVITNNRYSNSNYNPGKKFKISHMTNFYKKIFPTKIKLFSVNLFLILGGNGFVFQRLTVVGQADSKY